MSCACENKRMATERERIRRLAKAWARVEKETAVLYKKPDGTYNFAPAKSEIEHPIIEYITAY